MKKIKDMLRRIGTAGLAAIMLTVQMPVTAFAEEIAQPQEIVVSDEVLPAEVQMEDVLPGEREGGIKEGPASEESDEDILNASETDDEAVQAGAAPLTEKEASEKTADEAASENVEKQDEAVEEQEAQESYKKDADGNKEKEKKTPSEEEERPAFSESKSIDGVKITVSADKGVFLEGATLSVEKVSTAQEKQAEEAVESERDEDKQVAASYTYDIKVLDQDGNEIQPAGENKVNVSFKLEEVADSNLETNIYHIKEADPNGTDSGKKAGNDKADSEETSESSGAASDNKASDNMQLIAEKLPVETDGDTAIAETDGFSFYTVEFTYDNKQYVLPGDSEAALSEILGTVGLTGEVSAVEVSDESLFSAKKCKTAESGKTPEKDEDGKAIEDENGTWFVFAHKAFSTEEWMKVTIGGVVYEITVTDEMLTSVSYVDENGEEQTAEKVDVVTTAMEGYEYKFVSAYDDGWLYVKNDVTLNGASNNASYPTKLILGDGATLTINGYLGISYVDLTIYCQSGGTGKLVINANCISNPALLIANSRTLTINGGTVEVKNSHVSGGGFDGNLVMNGGTASFEGGGNGIDIGETKTVAFKGGSLTAVGGGWGISDGTVTLDYKDSTDQIKVSSYSTYSSSTVTIAGGKYFKDDDGNLYSGTLTKEQKTAIAGKTLKPAIFHGISVDSSITGGSITAATTIAAEASSATGGQTVTLTAAPDEGYELDTVTVTKNGGEEVATSGTGNTRAFTMPEEAVTVSATFTLAPKTGSCGASASDHVTYTLTDTDKDNKYDKLEIAGTGAMADFQADGSNLPWYDHRENIKTLTIAEGVTRIGTGAFRNIAGITSVTIPASVTGIGDNAFVFTEGINTALKTVSFASGSQCRSIGEAAFQYRGGLANITLPAELESIGDKAFYNDTALTSIDIPSKVTSIGDSVFYNCTNLATVRILGSPATIGSLAFRAGASTPDGLTVYASAVNKTDALESLYEGSTGSPRNLVYICTAPEAPETSSFTYNGAEKTVTIAAPANCGYTVTGDKQTNVGSYTATATLNTGKSEEMNYPRITITKQYVWGDASTLTPAASDETDAKTYAWSITPKPVTVSGIKAKNKEYDATTTAMLDYSGVTFAGKADGDSLTVTATGVFENTSAGEGKTVTISDLTLGGESVGNYTLAESGQQTSATATITKKPVTITGLSASDKVYDGTTAASITGGTIDGKVGDDEVSFTAGSATFVDANVNENKTVTFSGYSLSGTAAGNYRLSAQPASVTANITAHAITITAKPQSVELGSSIATGTDQVEVSSGGLVSGHSIYGVTAATGNERNAVGTFDGAITVSGAVIRDANGNDVTGNYEITYVNGSLTVTKVKARVITAPTANDNLKYTGSSQELLATVGEANTSMEYFIGTNTTTEPDTGWNATPPAGTDAKEYYVWYRAAGDDDHEAGDPDCLTVVIGKKDYYQPSQIPDITQYVPSDKEGEYTLSLPALPSSAKYYFTKSDENGVISTLSESTEENSLTFTTNSGKTAGTTAVVTVEAKDAPNYEDYSFKVNIIVSDYTVEYAWPKQTNIWLDADNELAWADSGITLDTSKLTVKKNGTEVTNYTAKVGSNTLTSGTNTLALDPGAYRIAITGDNGKLDDWVDFKVIHLIEDETVFSLAVDDCTWGLDGGSAGNASDTPPKNTAKLLCNEQELTYSTDTDLDQFLSAHPGLKLWFKDNDHTPGNAYVSRVFTLNGLSDGDFYNMPEPRNAAKPFNYLGTTVATGKDDQLVFLPHGVTFKQLTDDDGKPVPASSKGGTIYYLCVDPPALHYVETEVAEGTEWALYNGDELVPEDHYFRDSENNVYYGNGSAYTRYNAGSENGNFISFSPISYVVHGGPGVWNMDNIKIDPDNEYTFSFYMNDKWHECSLPNDNYELVGKDFVILNGAFFYTGNIVPVVVDGNKIKIGDSFIRSADDDGGGLHTPIVWLRNATIADLVGEERNCPHAYAKNKVNDYTYQIASCSFLIYPNNSLIEVYNSKNEYKVGEDVTCSVVLHGPKTAVANVFLNGVFYQRLEGTRAHELKLTGLHEGKYAVDVFLDGDDYVTPYNTLASFTVEKTDPELTLTGTTPTGAVFTDGANVEYHPENPVIVNAVNDKPVSGTNWKWTIPDTGIVEKNKIVNESAQNAVNSESIYLNTLKLGEVTLSARFSGDYKYNRGTESMSFTVVPMQVTKPIIEVLNEDKLYYDGTAKEPAVKVYYAENKLIPATEYDVTYSNNTNASKENNKAKVIVKSKTGSLYSIDATKEFVIQETVPTIEVLPTASEITYGQKLSESTISGGTAKVGELTVTGDYAWKDTTIAPKVSDSETTEYDVVFTPDSSIPANANYLPADLKLKLKVNKADIPTTDITAPTAKTNLIYNGSAQALINAGSVAGNIGTIYYAVTDSKETSAPEFDGTSAAGNKKWSTSVPTRKNAGTYYVWYKVEGDGNHKGTDPRKLEIEIVLIPSLAGGRVTAPAGAKLIFARYVTLENSKDGIPVMTSVKETLIAEDCAKADPAVLLGLSKTPVRGCKLLLLDPETGSPLCEAWEPGS